MPVYDPKRTFPPTQGTFSFKRSSDKLPQSSWVKPGEKPIKLTPAMRTELSRAIGEKNVRVLETDIGFAPRREREPPQVDPMFRYETAWQQAPRPVFKQATEVKANDAGSTFLSNPYTGARKNSDWMRSTALRRFVVMLTCLHVFGSGSQIFLAQHDQRDDRRCP